MARHAEKESSGARQIERKREEEKERKEENAHSVTPNCSTNIWVCGIEVRNGCKESQTKGEKKMPKCNMMRKESHELYK